MLTYYKNIDSYIISFDKKGGTILKKKKKSCKCGCAMKIERRGGKVIETCPCNK